MATRPGGKKLGALWGYVGVNAGEVIAAHLYVATGKKTGQRPNELGPEDVLALREGLTVADASSLFDASFQRAELIECGCNMHAREIVPRVVDLGAGGDFADRSSTGSGDVATGVREGRPGRVAACDAGLA
jgi:hypothetical protein